MKVRLQPQTKVKTMNNKEKKQKQELDTQTTFADMNVDGFRWYDPSRKKGGEKQKIQCSRKEKRAIYRAYMQALLPFIGILCGVFLLMFLLARLWLS